MSNSKMLSQNVAENLMSMIAVDKRFRIGDKLPNELDLAEELGVSRTTLREAIRSLIAYGVLEIQRGRGTFVTSQAADFGKTADPLSNIDGSLKELFEMRLIIEPEAAFLAAQRGTDSELKRIVEQGEKIEKNAKLNKRSFKDEYLFHQIIAQATHNAYMKQVIPILYSGVYRGTKLSIEHAELTQHSLADHRLIMEFLRNRNADGARNAMKIHLLHSIETLESE